MKIPAIFISALLSTAAASNTVGFDFLRLPVSARAAAASVSLIGYNDHSLSLRNNPAMLAGINRPAFSLDFSPVIMDIYSGAFSMALILDNGSVLAPSVSYVNFGTLDRAVDENADEINARITPFSLSADLAWAKKFYETLNVGARIKFVHEQISQQTAYWDAYFSGGFAMDLGIFAQRNFFRYSAGLRNLGFTYDNYESANIRFPASSFAGIGVVIEAEAKLAWFLEAEKFFYDYLFFRTGFEFPVHRDILVLRTGTIFTPDDIGHLVNTFRGRTVRAWEYSSGTWLLASVGATVNARIAGNLLALDIACQFRKDGLRPSFVFSGTMYF